MNAAYRIREDKMEKEGETYIVYGIDVFEESGEGAQRIRCVKDIFCEREPAAKLAALCTELALDPIQLDDVIADAIAQV